MRRSGSQFSAYGFRGIGRIWCCIGPPSAFTDCRLGPSDLFRVIAERPKDQVPLRVWRSSEERPTKERIDVLPDDLSFLSNFEEAAVGRLADECVAVRQALS